MEFFESALQLPLHTMFFFFFALVIAFGFEFINGFHDTANAVTTVIYTRAMSATPAVIYSGFMNFVGVLAGGTAVAFSIVNLLPVDLLIDSQNGKSLIMVLSLLIGGIIWNLGTWYIGLPVSTSHTLIGSILGVGLVNSFLKGSGLGGINWTQATTVLMALVISPLVGFVLSAVVLLVMKFLVRDERLYKEMPGDAPPPSWIRTILVTTCGGVSFAHGSNDGQKGMGLILLVLIGFMPFHYAMDIFDSQKAQECRVALEKVRDAVGDKAPSVRGMADQILQELEGKKSLAEVSPDRRWELRTSLFEFLNAFKNRGEISAEMRRQLQPQIKEIRSAIEFVPLWVVAGVALALGIGTTIGYKRIVVTVAEKIGKSHLTFGQGAAAESVAALTILGAVFFHLPVSTTHVLSSGIAGTMAANRSGVQMETCRRIGMAWMFTLPISMALSGTLYLIGTFLFAG